METGGGSSTAAAASQALVEPFSAAPATAAAASAASAAGQTAAPNEKTGNKEKKGTAISWSYGEDETPVSGASRFYVDLNVHVTTENYAPGEMVDITIEDDDGADIVEGVKQLTLRARVDAEGKAKVMNAFAGKTIITVPEESAA
ncbi:hypothetical protein KY495_15980 [Massilia sp. PAMC28688]|uniref:hypothetical protein n=1 Tax=Massilia sp. PAMC28688 TaxID=2861283 RepID=UPI001C6289C7|nr:hypothetical protein [Massilia sp. PAMC28688]QYF92249.1 hypothetical protein KY495_15980 [Massilia sp. PAMC28688]